MPLTVPTSRTTTDPTGKAMAPTGSGSTGGSAALQGMGSDAFMKLLVAQMKYQNPMSPSDGTEYLAQISQYAMVEQLQKVNQGQQEVATYQRAMIAGSMIGKQVSGTTESGRAVSGVVTSVTFPAGKAVLVTTGGELSVDRVDEARLLMNAAAAPAAATNSATATAAAVTTSTSTAQNA